MLGEAFPRQGRGQVYRSQEFEASRISTTSGSRRWQGCRPYAPTILTRQEIPLVLTSVRG